MQMDRSGLREYLDGRMSRRRFLKLGGAGLARMGLMGLSGCGVFQSEEGGGGQQGGGGGGNTFSYDLKADIPDLNSTTTTDSVSFVILTNVMEGLYRLDENEEPQPALAEGVEVSDDGLDYTFTLRDGLTWSDGEPLTAEHFRYAFVRAVDPETAGQYAFIVSDFIRGAAEFAAGEGSAEDVAVEAVDEKTLRVSLANPAPFFLGLTSFITYMPLRQDFVEAQGEDFAQRADALLYNGPFTMTEFNPAEGATLKKNDAYWDKANVAVDGIDLRIVKEADTRVNLYESGELDVGEISSEYVNRYREDPAFNTIVNFASWFIVFNQEEPIFQNENIRKGIQAGFDREVLATDILNDGSVAAEGYVPTGIAATEGTFREAVGPVVPEFDPAAARALYEAGVEELGENPTITLLADDTDTARDASTFIQSQLQENLGANVEINIQPFDRRLELTEQGEYQFALYGWIGDYNDPMTFLDLWTNESSFNVANFENERYTELVNGAKQEADEQARIEALIEAEKVLIEEQAALAPAYFEGTTRLVRPSVKGIVFHPFGSEVDFKTARIEG